MPKQYFPIAVDIIRISAAAVLCNDGGNEGWIPKALIEGWDDSEYEPGNSVELNVEEWFLEKEGWV